MPQPDFDILYEEGPVLAVNKPSGLLSQAPIGIDSLETRVKAYLMETEGRGENGYLGVPHRLDRPVSGVILFGKHSRATHRISEQFEARQVDKTYWAIVDGLVAEESGTWIDYMRKVPDKAVAEIVAPINPDAREAILQFIVLKRFADKNATFLEIRLETGRMHQIRLQASTHGYPILGDAMYGSTRPFGERFDDERQRAVALHARSIAFLHPMTKEPVQLVAPLPSAWTEFEIGS